MHFFVGEVVRLKNESFTEAGKIVAMASLRKYGHWLDRYGNTVPKYCIDVSVEN
jgi:uncharacterized protein YodC (DUF2158 family)